MDDILVIVISRKPHILESMPKTTFYCYLICKPAWLLRKGVVNIYISFYFTLTCQISTVCLLILLGCCHIWRKCHKSTTTIWCNC